MLIAFRIDLYIAIVSVAGSVVLGILLGSISGFFGGKVDESLMRISDIIQTFPMLLVALVLAVFLGIGIRTVILVAVIINIPMYAKLVRGDILSRKSLGYVDAARCSGCRDARDISPPSFTKYH